MKYDHEAAKKVKLAAMNAKKTTRRSKKKKKTTAEDLMKLDDTSDSEVVLDSLGQFFNNLIDTDPYQDDTGASQALEEEVTIISSDSEPLPRQKIRRVICKVRFSNPLAHLDPNFILKKQQHESRRQARTKDEPAVVLQQTPQKHQNEVYFFVFDFLLMDALPCITYFALSLQEVSRSSGDSSQTEFPAFKTAPG